MTGRRERRNNLFAKDPHCKGCGCEVFNWDGPPRNPPPLNLATLDHLDDRMDPERGRHKGEIRTVLACWRCNHERNVERHATMPLDVLHERSTRHRRRR